MNNDYLLLDNAKQRGTFHSARWQCDYSPDLCWISMTVGHSTAHSLPPLWFLVISPTVSTDLQLFISASNIPIIRGVQRRRWNFRKADWASYTFATERSIPLIPVNNISIEELCQRFCGAMQKAACHSIPRGFCQTYTPCLDEEYQDLLKQYEESGEPDIADHLIE